MWGWRGAGDVLVDGSQQVRYAGEHTSAQTFDGDIAKEALDHVQPGCRGRREVHDEARMPGQLCGNDLALHWQGRARVGQVWMKITVLTGSNFDGLQHPKEFCSGLNSIALRNPEAFRQDHYHLPERFQKPDLMRRDRQ